MGQNSAIYLQRIGFNLPDTRHASRWVSHQLRSHRRPTIPAPGLLGRDRPDRRAQTMPLKKVPALFDHLPVSYYPDAECPEEQCKTGCL